MSTITVRRERSRRHNRSPRSKQWSDDDDSEERSPSPTMWAQQVEQREFHRDDNINTYDDAQQAFSLQKLNERQEIVNDDEESEMESDYVDTEVTVEELRITQVPYEEEVEETESVSGYTSAASTASRQPSPNPNSTAKKHNRSKCKQLRDKALPPRRKSMPAMHVRNVAAATGTHYHAKAINDENRPPPASSAMVPVQITPVNNATKRPLSTVNEDHKEREHEEQEQEQPQPEQAEEQEEHDGHVDVDVHEQEPDVMMMETRSDVHHGSVDRSALLSEHFSQNDAALHTRQKKKQSILPPKQLDSAFEEVLSPAPPSILATAHRRNALNDSNLTQTTTTHDQVVERNTPHFSNIYKNLASIGDLWKPHHQQQHAQNGGDDDYEFETEAADNHMQMHMNNMNMEVDPSPLGQSRQSSMTVDSELITTSKRSSYKRKKMTKKVLNTTQRIMSGLDEQTNKLRLALPSPATLLYADVATTAATAHHDPSDHAHEDDVDDDHGHARGDEHGHGSDDHEMQCASQQQATDVDVEVDPEPEAPLRRSLRLAKKPKSMDDSDRSSSSDEKITLRRSQRHKKTQKPNKNDDDDDAAVMVQASKPKTKTATKHRASKTGKSKTNANEKRGKQARQTRQEVAEEEEEDDEEEDDEEEQEEEHDDSVMPQTVISTVRRKTVDANFSAASDRSNLSLMSVASNASSTHSGRRTLRSRKDAMLEHTDMEADDLRDDDDGGVGTFDTPNRTNTSNRSNKSKTKASEKENKTKNKGKTGGKAAAQTKKQKAEKKPRKPTKNAAAKTKKTKSKQVAENEIENETTVDDHRVMDDDMDDMHDVGVPDNMDMNMEMEMDGVAMNDEMDDLPAAATSGDALMDSPNINENDDEKQETENERSDDEEEEEADAEADRSKTKSKGKSGASKKKTNAKSKSKVKKTTKPKTKTSKTRKSKKSGKEEEEDDENTTAVVQLKKTKGKGKAAKKSKSEKKEKTSKNKKTRKRKAFETDISDSSSEHEPKRKRKRLSQYVANIPQSVEQAQQANVRRSTRVRFKPLAFWANERIEHQTEPLTFEKVMTSFEKGGAESIIQGGKNELNSWSKQVAPKSKGNKKSRSKKKTDDKQEAKKKSSSSSKRGRKKRKKKKEEDEDDMMDADDDMAAYNAYDDDEDDDDDADGDAQQTRFDGNAWVYDSTEDAMRQKCVIKTRKCIQLVELAPPELDDNEEGDNGNHNKNGDSHPMSQRVRGAKGLEEESFSCGVLEIPPCSEKAAEISYFTEQFFVHQCEAKQLLFKLGESSFHLSRGAMFFVPPENEYSLHNLSKTHAVRLIFTLIKSKHQNEAMLLDDADDGEDCDTTQTQT